MRSLARSLLRSATGSALAFLAIGSIGSVASAQAGAQLTPNVMLLVDTSGSMERMPACACTTEACTECLPTCSNSPTGTNQMNRWSTVLQALTGTYPSFTCRQDARPTSSAEPDYGYYIPHYSITSTTQTSDGVLDTYANRIKFGLMTFDNIATSTTQATLVTQAGWPGSVGASSTGSAGDYSYGLDAVFDLPACSTPFQMNNGARNYTATNHGRLLSPGTDATDTISSANAIQTELLSLRPYGATPTAGMMEDLEYFYDNDPAVNSTGDSYRTCRNQYVILISDGYPNADMRGAPYNCENVAGDHCPYDQPEVTAARLCQPQNGRCTGLVDGVFVIGFNVSGDASAIARLNAIATNGGTDASMYTADPADTNQAFLADDLSSLKAAIETALNQAAPDALSRAGLVLSSTASQADLITTQQTTTVSSAVLQSQFNAGFEIPSSGAWEGVLERRRTTCNGTTPQEQAIGPTDRFQDLLDARSSATAQDITDPSPTSARTLFTVVPTNAANVKGYLTGTGVASGLTPMGTATTDSARGGGSRGNGGSNCTAQPGHGNSGGGGGSHPHGTAGATTIGPVQTGLDLVPFTWAGIGSDRALFGSGINDSEAQSIVSWVRGDRGGRSKLGDIYHSTPVIVGRPVFNIADESFNEFRRTVVPNRPTMLYVGSNDGVLHAFVAEDTTVTINGSRKTFRAGHELWGFVPPFVYPSLKAATSSHIYTVDGSPYVREVFYRRVPNQAPDASIYHTILVVPMGMGGGAYIALDITNPFDPKFMWQFTAGDEMGTTLGAPAIGQVLVNTTTGLEERAIAILPAGAVPALDSASCGPIAQGDQWSQPLGCPSNGRGTPPLNQGTQNAVEHHRCWDTTGRHVYFVDPATGQAVAHLGSEVFDAPMTGGVGLFSGDTGTISTRVFMSDADANLWRFDISNTNPQNWDAIPLADMFTDIRTQIPVGGQPAYNAPLISTDSQGRVVIIQGTGNPEDFNSTAPNRVVSYTETLTYTTGTPTVGLITNWIQPLGNYIRTATSGNYGEQVTGPLQLYNGVVYFASYRPPVNTTTTCGVGTSYLWGLDYVAHTGTDTPVPKLSNLATPPVFSSNVTLSNQVVMGVTIAQQVSCLSFDAVDTSIYDPFLGTRSGSGLGGSGGGAFQLLALTNGGSATTGSSIGEITRTLPPPPSYSRVSGIAGRAE